MKKMSVQNIHFKDQRALIRVDYNVPLDDKQQITDDTRIRETLPTLNKILNDGGRCIIMSHLGRPKGKKNPSMSLKPCAARLSELLGRPVQMADDCIGPDVEKTAASLKNGEVLMLENLRFHAVLYGLYPFRPAFGLISVKTYERKLAGCLGKDLVDAWREIAGDQVSTYARFGDGKK